jgi:hypothetical protein
MGLDWETEGGVPQEGAIILQFPRACNDKVEQ